MKQSQTMLTDIISDDADEWDYEVSSEPIQPMLFDVGNAVTKSGAYIRTNDTGGQEKPVLPGPANLDLFKPRLVL